MTKEIRQNMGERGQDFYKAWLGKSNKAQWREVEGRFGGCGQGRYCEMLVRGTGWWLARHGQGDLAGGEVKCGIREEEDDTYDGVQGFDHDGIEKMLFFLIKILEHFQLALRQP